MTDDLVYDVGMNNGDDTAYYLSRGYRVVAVEANPELVVGARRRFSAEIRDARLVIINVGITDVEGEADFWVCERHSEWSSFDRSLASREESLHRRITVQCVRFSSILEQHGTPFYLKVDIEGNDLVCLEQLQKRPVPTHISVEASDIMLLDLLHALGYDRFKCISQFHFLPLELPASELQLRFEQAQRESKPLNAFRVFDGWEFPAGSSGVFGEDLPGRWQTHAEMRQTFAHFKALQSEGVATPFWNDKGYSFWADFHAVRSS